jgi:hypothetical protein
MTLTLRERVFESGSLLPEGEGLGMRAVNLRKKSGMLPVMSTSIFFGAQIRGG